MHSHAQHQYLAFPLCPFVVPVPLVCFLLSVFSIPPFSLSSKPAFAVCFCLAGSLLSLGLLLPLPFLRTLAKVPCHVRVPGGKQLPPQFVQVLGCNEDLEKGHFWSPEEEPWA